MSWGQRDMVVNELGIYMAVKGGMGPCSTSCLCLGVVSCSGW